MLEDPTNPTFAVFTEVGIINQIATAFLEDALPDGLIAPHFAVLNHLIRIGDGQTPLEMARALQVPKASFTHTLAGLQRRQLVEARPNPKDGRSKQVWITDRGRRVVDETVVALYPLFKQITGRLDSDAMAELLPRLRGLRTVVDALRDGEPKAAMPAGTLDLTTSAK